MPAINVLCTRMIFGIILLLISRNLNEALGIVAREGFGDSLCWSAVVGFPTNDSDAEKPLTLREVAQPLFGKHLGWNLFAIRNLGSTVHSTIALRCVELVRDPGPTKLIWLQAVAA